MKYTFRTLQLNTALLLGCISMFACNGNNNSTDDPVADNAENYKKRVGRIEYYNPSGSLASEVFFTYDSEDHVLKDSIAIYSKSGILVQIKKHQYAKGVKVKTTEYNKDVEGEESTWYFEYQDSLLMREVEVTASGDTNTIMRYQYDDNGNRIEETVISGGDIQIKNEFTYTDFNKTRVAEQYNGAGELVQHNIYNYADTLLQEIIFLKNGDTISRWQYEYNPENKVIRITEPRPDGSKTVLSSYVYDHDGNLLAEEHAKYNPRRIDYLYDKKGHLTQEKYKDPKGTTLQIKYYE